MLPPEITSAQIYAGPGSASFMAAASAWNGVAAELSSGALGLNQVITELSGEEWLGPASASMAAAAQPYLEWMTTTAAQAEEAAAQAQSAAAAYETVLGSITPPPYIALNRAELAQATATNVLGQNNNVIAQLEAQYQEFWATEHRGDVQLRQSVRGGDEVDVVRQRARGCQSGRGRHPGRGELGHLGRLDPETLQKYLTEIQTALGQLSTPAGTSKLVSQLGAENPLLTQAWFLLTGSARCPRTLAAFVNGYSPYASFFYNTEGLPYFSVGMGNFGVQIAKTTGAIGGAAAPAAAAVPKGLPGLGGLLGGGAGAAAHLGSATSIGKLSVPATWAGNVQAAAPHATAIPVSSISAAPEAGGPGNLLGGMPLAGAELRRRPRCRPTVRIPPHRHGPTARSAGSCPPIQPDVASRHAAGRRGFGTPCGAEPRYGACRVHHLFDSTRGRVAGGALRSRRGLYLRPDFIWGRDFQPRRATRGRPARPATNTPIAVGRRCIPAGDSRAHLTSRTTARGPGLRRDAIWISVAGLRPAAARGRRGVAAI